MQEYTLTEARNHHGRVFDEARTEPVLLTKNNRPSHVVMSVEAYEDMVGKLLALGERPKRGKSKSLKPVYDVSELFGILPKPKKPVSLAAMERAIRKRASEL